MSRRLSHVLLAIAMAFATVRCGSLTDTALLKEIQRAKFEDVEVVLLSKADSIKSGKDQAVLEFRTGADHHLVDLGALNVNASMVMPGMSPMLGGVTVTDGDTPGRYVVATDLSMAGTWRFEVSWGGPAGRGEVSLSSTVR